MSPSATDAYAVTIRRASRRDLDALVELERGFPGDRISRAGLSRLLTRESAEVWVAEIEGAVVGDAVVLYRLGYDSARLYSMVVDPRHRGRGIAKRLLEAAEQGAKERGIIVMRLEVREENRAARLLYEQAGYTVRDRTEEYYQDNAAALRLVKRFVKGGATVRGVPYRAQALSFTSGGASLMMAMKFHGYPVPLDDWLELTLWRESTTTFSRQGHGGVSAHGLAVAALRRGFQARVITPATDVPFGAGLADEELEVARVSHAGFERELRSLGGKVEVRDFSHADVAEALERGTLPLALLTGPADGEGEGPQRRWVPVTGFDDERLYLHDPLLTGGAERADNVHLPIKREAFERALPEVGEAERALLLIERWGTVNRRSPDS